WHAARQVQVQQRLAVAIVDEEEVARTPLPELDEHARTLPPLRFDVTRERAHRRRLHDGTERKFHTEAPRDFREQCRREQRGASEREVVIGYPKPFDLEQLLPQLEQLALSLRGGHFGIAWQGALAALPRAQGGEDGAARHELARKLRVTLGAPHVGRRSDRGRARPLLRGPRLDYPGRIVSWPMRDSAGVVDGDAIEYS